ncbi:XRE family transcriptional regulator [Xanthomonas campestris pv. raphani]|uniref:helix-turn-helix domain-containing protein n=1 Tax=Xanthomonas campestris TaxID=339 RepID=UPI0023678565|nr:XRE family transcriptional regulator [Xanthomonas campestris]MEA9824576.1 XRE family transcriptional regulator [Xanthomonas campestris pv. raphani]MEA9853002.1 XRE family transcriptional regulator [Xanthomonas campestris pv. raphani]MEA9856896.1 XRE family transcriptional regulator [Xanthomonas campestris pv. raphani]MEA9966028.1 XRE family transcriptional regulator [Xanthomonas campestris pv. raphani]WDJ22015.1 ImmA/IrrE family metallo-endopeptidase [Xanthomonas campestris pv. raphani]
MSRAIENFQPARLEQALAARSFSAVELAARVGVTSTTVSRWRNKAQLPSGELLFKVAQELRVSPEWLTREPAPQTSRPYFRGSIAQMKGDRALLYARIEWLAEIASQLERYVDYPAVNVPRLPFKKASEISDQDIEQAAMACRQAWGLKDGPVSNVVLLLENAGVIVAREETGTARIEGLSAWTTSGRPLVLLCADKANGFRSRFDAAHELGHLVLHSYIEAPNDAATHKLIEQQAHRFAGAFLLPATGFVSEVSVPVSLQGLLLLKLRWGVSVAAMILRLKAQGVIEEADYLRLIKLRSAKWGNKQEPKDEDRAPELPRLLGRTVDLLHESGVVTKDALPAFVGLSGADLEGLLGLPWGSLTRPAAEVVALGAGRVSAEPGAATTLREGTVVTFPGRRS